MPITHAKVTAIPDDPAYDVGSDEWNDAHTIGTPLVVQGANGATQAQVVIRNGTTRATIEASAQTAPFAVLRYTAVTPGTAGNAITVATVDPGANNVPLSVAVVGSAITVTIATDGTGVKTSTAADVAAAINAYGPSAALITATVVSSPTGLFYQVISPQALDNGLAASDALVVEDDAKVTVHHQLTVINPGANPSSAPNRYGASFEPEDAGWDGAIYFELGDTTALTGNAYILCAENNLGIEQFSLDAYGDANIRPPAGTTAGWAWKAGDGTGVFAVNMGPTSAASTLFLTAKTIVTELIIEQTTAPADADIPISHVAFWFDPTPGASKLMYKGQDSGSTFVTGALPHLTGNAAQYLDGTGNYSTPAGGAAPAFLSVAKWA